MRSGLEKLTTGIMVRSPFNTNLTDACLTASYWLLAEFNIIDTNHGGHILFSEFVEWAISKDLDIEDDED